ncbi:VOC family protein [Sphingobium phenoxybenzoativorans]|uniref:VOC family protein n=1 Tax=Sphingobium phenoxybenzoativorans TaxID=1592790 RepID=A0A975Q1T7_9SPHN|nr:VOC family protein [Sphingobium phenoxybenzoativorans]QUT06144.1 VOC family protein [Sphingobium phenoxybenzoativorans]
MKGKSPVIPCLRYADAPAAIDFLCAAFGFQRHAVYTDEADPSVVHHAQLTLGDGMIMLGSDRPGGVKDLYRWKTPAEAGGITQCVCCYVADVDAHAATAKAAGAHIVRGPYDNDGYPGRGYDALDTEGNVWNFGSYDAWEG